MGGDLSAGAMDRVPDNLQVGFSYGRAGGP